MNRTVIGAVLAAMLAFTSSAAQVLRPVFTFPREYTSSVTIDDAGTTIYAVSSTNQFGTNPSYLKQIVKWDAVSGAGTPITDYEEGVASVSVSDDGSWLAFVTGADLLGTNHDESRELYVMHPDGTGLAQLTSALDGDVNAAVISGSANRIAFVGTIDPLGTNPSRKTALFVIDRDGTNLKQLALDVVLATEIAPTGYRPGLGLDISDDGGRIVYITGSREIAGINANGTGNHVFSSTTSAADVVLSGNGAKIAYATGGLLAHSVRTRSFDGNPFTIVFLSNGESPAITDDAVSVYLYRYASGPIVAGIWRMPSTGGGAATLISAGRDVAKVSGSGNRIAARDAELIAIDNAGGSVQELTTTTVVGESIHDLSLSPDASTLFFSSRMDPLGTNPAREYEQFAFALGTEQFTQLTNGSLALIGTPSFADDGSILFDSIANLTGQNPCGHGQIFRLDPDGVITQLTVCSTSYDWNAYPHVSGDGQTVAFFSEDSNESQVFSVNGDGTGRTQLTTDLGNALTDIDLGVGGPPTWVAYSGLAGGRFEVFRVKSDGTGLQKLTTGGWDANPPTISGDGQRLAWVSRSDYIGQNPDQSFEAFAFVSPSTIRQLSHDDVSPGVPRVTRDGSKVFLADSRYHMSTSVLEPAAGPYRPFELLPDATGGRWLVHVDHRLDYDPTLHQALYLADMTAVPALSVGKASPTELSWELSPTSLTYDVIRGSIANLSIVGSTVGLGPVTCIEDDSPDAHTKGHADPVNPAPGEAFFFLYSGSVGFDASAGSYGQGTGGRERVAGSGGCGP